MKTLFRILIVATFLGIVYYYSNSVEPLNEPLEGPNQSIQAIPKVNYEEIEEQAIARPNTGISTLVGKTSDTILERYGQPSRKDVTSYGYEWWIYDTNDFLLMIAITKQQVSQVYTNDPALDVAPYSIGQTLDEIYRMTIFESESTAKIEENLYMFMMNEEDMHSRILVKFNGVFAQLYIDQETDELSGIRYLNDETLIMHQPYEMQFVGNLLEPSTPSSFLQMDINAANAMQLVDLLNTFRVKNGATLLLTDEAVSTVAAAHSEDMFLQNFVAHESPTYGSLTNRLDDQFINYEEAAENLATGYIDAIEVIHGWLNSPEHRTVMLDDIYTHVGSGVFINYFTQVFITKSQEPSLLPK